MSKTAVAISPSDTGLLKPRRSERMLLRRLRDRLAEAEAEWRHVVESLERQRSTVRALARSTGESAARLAHANRGLDPGMAPDALAGSQKQLDADQVAYERALRSYERSLATAEHARARLHREMSRLREEIRVCDRQGLAKGRLGAGPESPRGSTSVTLVPRAG